MMVAAPHPAEEVGPVVPVTCREARGIRYTNAPKAVVLGGHIGSAPITSQSVAQPGRATGVISSDRWEETVTGYRRRRGVSWPWIRSGPRTKRTLTSGKELAFSSGKEKTPEQKPGGNSELTMIMNE